jgi:hypothetical protein
MNIPDEAVEVAAKAILRGTDEGHHAYKIAYATLEAAAPHLMAAAWEQGREDGYHHRPNPYKETT